ncbi:DUF4282 domain-containing protein [Leifsonia sp. McL0607]|uniref:DUF4282 domain-containing protein n=1 Tax=Leifsonia sp. McL0607 TaxID=3415672 RepID=UPI003CEFA313
MTSAQPPSNGDRPAAGQEAAPQAAASPEAGTPEAATPEAATQAASESTASQERPTAPSPAPKRTTSRRAPAARKPDNADTPVKRTPSTRKRSTATPPISPNGEAPEILDAMLGKPAQPSAAAPDTSSSPVEPVERAEEPVENTPEPPETETAVLPSAADFYRESTAETEVLAPAEVAVAEQLRAEREAVPAQEVPVRAAAETARTPAPAAPSGGTSPAGGTSPSGGSAPTEGSAEAQDTAGGTRHARSVNELADRLDESRFFSSLFDFTFTSYVTRKLAGPVYVVGLVLIGLAIIVGFANSLGIAIAADSPGGAFVFLLGVLVTLVAAILAVLLLRVTIEVFCAVIEIAQNTRRRRPPRD